jgi:hypothetical protein
MAHAEGLDDPVGMARRNWPHDKGLELITKAATTPGSMSSSNWAGAIVGATVPDFLGALGPASASAMLLARGTQFVFDNTGFIILPATTATASNADFIGENAPFPVIQFDSSSKVILAPRKFATISVFTHETFQHTTPNVEAVVRATLAQSVGLALDSKLLDTVAASATRPAGLRNGISAGSTSAATPRSEAMAADIASLVHGCSAVAGNASIIIVAAPAQAAALKLWNRANLDYEVLASSGLAAGVVVAIASNALVSAVDPAPRFEIVNQTALHFDSSSPLDITTAAVAATTKSLFQSDLVGLRTIFELSWGLRDPAGLAWLGSVTW